MEDWGHETWNCGAPISQGSQGCRARRQRRLKLGGIYRRVAAFGMMRFHVTAVTVTLDACMDPSKTNLIAGPQPYRPVPFPPHRISLVRKCPLFSPILPPTPMVFPNSGSSTRIARMVELSSQLLGRTSVLSPETQGSRKVTTFKPDMRRKCFVCGSGCSTMFIFTNMLHSGRTRQYWQQMDLRQTATCL